MCEQIDAMKAVQRAAECLSAACRAGSDPLLEPLRRLYAAAAAEPVPAEIARALDELGADQRSH